MAMGPRAGRPRPPADMYTDRPNHNSSRIYTCAFNYQVSAALCASTTTVLNDGLNHVVPRFAQDRVIDFAGLW